MDAQHPHSQLPPWSQVLRTGSNQTVVHHEPMDAGHPHSQLDPGHVFNEGCGTNGTPGQSVQNPSSAEATGAVELRRIRRVQTCIAIAILLKHFYRCTFLDTVMINKMPAAPGRILPNDLSVKRVIMDMVRSLGNVLHEATIIKFTCALGATTAIKELTGTHMYYCGKFPCGPCYPFYSSCNHA